MHRSTLAAVLATTLLLAPLALAHHTPPASDIHNAGSMKCERSPGSARYNVSGSPNSAILPILRTTDNGHLRLEATGNTGFLLPTDKPCFYEVRVTGYVLQGVNPMGGILNYVSTPCAAGAFASCTAAADLDWWVNFVGPDPTSTTWEIQVNFELRVNGIFVGNGSVRIVEPSLPPLVLP